MENAAFLAVLFGLLTAIGWGIADFWSARAAKNVGPVTALFYVNSVGVIAFGLLCVVLQPDIHLTARGVWYALASGVLITIAASLFYKGLAAGPVSLVSPITGAYPLVSALLAVLFFGASLSIAQGLAICMIVAGVMAASGLFSLKKSERHLSRGPRLSLYATVFYGTGFTCTAQAVTELGWQLPLLITWTCGLPLLLLPFVKDNERILASAKRAITDKYLIGAALVGVTAFAVFNIGFLHDATAGSITIAVSGCYPALTMALAIRHFKENISPIAIAGAACSIAGVIALSVL